MQLRGLLPKLRRAGSVLTTKKSIKSAYYATATKAPKGTDIKEVQETKYELQAALVAAASLGDVPSVKRLIEVEKAKVNVGDYDHRSALHLAAAEGQIEALEYLVLNGGDVNLRDRWGNTPLEDAIAGKHANVVKFLRERGATLPKEKDVIGQLCTEAGQGNIENMDLLVQAGADLSSSDYDKRTPLHLASAEGQVKAVEWIIKKGANVNAIDRFGNTPLQDAERGTGRNFRVVAQVLREAGAREERGMRLFSGIDLQAAIHDSLPMLCERWEWNFAETWLPSKDGQEFVAGEHYADRDGVEAFRPLFEAQRTTQFALMGGVLSKAYETKSAVAIESIDEATLGPRFEAIKKAGVTSGIVIPIMNQEGEVAAVIEFFSKKPRSLGPEETVRFSRYTDRIVRAGLYQGTVPVAFEPVPGIPEGQMSEVFQKIVNEGVFNPSLVYHEVDWFYNMGLQAFYFTRFTPAILATHIHSYIAAKKFSTTTGSPEDIWLHIENNEKLLGPGGPEQALFMIPVEHHKMVAVERNIVKRINHIPANRPYSMEFFCSEQAHVPGSTKKLGIYVLQTHSYANPAKFGSVERNIWEVASDTFLADKSKFIRERYQDIIHNAMDRLSPVTRHYETYHDGTIPVMLAFSQRSGATPDYMLHVTELLKQMNLEATRKFIETFANGIIVYSLYLKPAPEAQIDKLLQAFGMLHLVPASSLTKYFLLGEYSAEEYTYLSAASRFSYYFINQRSEDYQVLADTFKNDPLNLGRLRQLAGGLRREAVSVARINDCLERWPDKVEKLFNDFQVRVKEDTKKRPIPLEVEDKLRKEIERDCETLDAQILGALITFNTSVLKTNLYKRRKSALSFRLDPSFLKQHSLDFPTVPFGMFFVMSSDFQGFHIRFQDVARGGIRIVKSRDATEYNKNRGTLFAENYGLAYTQNKKNKDIPEFGSKGCILLNADSQDDPMICFQKYCSGVLDLLIPHEDVVDNYGKQELLFFGPDEGTADFMEWAAKYSKSKGYPYWRSFTTGKPATMGGIPHDTFGMTTRSIHRYVLKTLEKFGMEENKVSKVQTGGPDGDLGSNEILISHDKTKAIVDGSGVLFDPEGINREELRRLAKERKMIQHFDVAKLSPKGFRVLTSETNKELPHGEKVENGVAFRNNFHLHPLAEADLFVPCGGRPESINLSNVRKLFDAAGKPRFKIIVEGANLFLTQDARMVLEDAGVVVYKDASTNKGGVTSSSLEVLAALALDDREFSKHMCVTPKNRPQFYFDYVKEIHKRIEHDADLEFECIWREAERTGNYRYVLTDLVSDKINELNHFVRKSTLYENPELRINVMKHAIPKMLQDLVGLDNIMKRVPEVYLKSIFSAYIASRYVYRFGIEANEFAFFEYIQPFLKLAPGAETPY